MPSGRSRDDLARLAALLARWRPQRLVILGDLFHAQLGEADASLIDGFTTFRAAHASLEILAIRGNHDRKTAAPPASLGLSWQDRLADGPFVFAHQPEADARGYVLAGHLHPVLRLRGAGDAARLPVFWFAARYGVLPAFGSLTGGHAITPEPDDRVIALTSDGLMALKLRKRAES